MSWLKKLMDEKLTNLPKDALMDPTFGFGDIHRVVEIVETALHADEETTTQSHRESLMAAARDAFPDGKGYSTFTSMAQDLWKTKMTFPRVARNALLIAIYSHAEFLLLSWCEQSAMATPKRLSGKPSLDHYLAFLRDEEALPFGDFKLWAEWQVMDAYRHARNCLAHHGGQLDAKTDRAAIASLPNVKIDESGLLLKEPMVLLLPGACQAAVASAQALIGRAVAFLDLDP